MNVENENLSSQQLDIVDAGDKMVAEKEAPLLTPMKEAQSGEQQLIITDVEGAVNAELSSIELDDIEDDNASFNRERQFGSGGSINDDSDVDADTSSESDGKNSNNALDPLGLLERLERNHDISIADDDDDDCSDGDCSTNSVKRLTKEERWQLWMNRWKWLLHEDNEYAFCLYCNIIINTNGKSKFIKQHDLSLYHQERESNYKAFKKSEEQTRGVTSISELKQEFGTSSYVAAMKQKRANEVETFNNFNWQRWLSAHPWLERVDTQGTVGLCKYCKSRLNVEFVYLRQRHESSKRHTEAERQYKEQQQQPSRKRKASESASESSSSEDPTSEQETVESASDQESYSKKFSAWIEMIPGDTGGGIYCRCKLCDNRMAITSARRHLGTKLHCSNLTLHKEKEKTMKQRGIWAQYADIHPWLVADPTAPSVAYCSVCDKRFYYGHSEIKRLTHEKSSLHTAAEAAANEKAEAADQVQQKIEMVPSEAASEMTSDQEEQVNADDSEAPIAAAAKGKRKRDKRLLHYNWLRYSKDRSTLMCKYCRVRIKGNKKRHELSSQHRNLVEQYKKRQEERKEQEQTAEAASIANEAATKAAEATAAKEAAAAAKPVPQSMQGKVMQWRHRFPWLSYKRSEMRSNYAWCKLCEVSVFLPTFKFASRHQRIGRHKQKVMNVSVGDVKQKVAMAELQAKYDWLEPDVNDENFCHCKLCDTRLPIKVHFLRQHEGSRKHTEQLERLKSNSMATTAIVEPAVAVEPEVSILELEPNSDSDVVSLKSESMVNEPEAKRARRSLDTRRILHAIGKRPAERSQIDLAKDMLNSSFDIVARLRSLDRETQTPNAPVEQPTASTPAPVAPRDIIDLFFDSITQTMKNLPADLATEGKAKIMQIICNLELRALSRNKWSAQAEAQPTASMKDKETTPPPLLHTSLDETQDSVNHTIQDEPTITINDDADVALSTDKNNSNKSVGSKAPIKILPRPAVATPSTSTTPTAATDKAQTEVVKKMRRLLPASVQVTQVHSDADILRCVPLDKLTTSSSDITNSGDISARTTTSKAGLIKRRRQTLAAPNMSHNDWVYVSEGPGQGSIAPALTPEVTFTKTTTMPTVNAATSTTVTSDVQNRLVYTICPTNGTQAKYVAVKRSQQPTGQAAVSPTATTTTANVVINGRPMLLQVPTNRSIQL